MSSYSENSKKIAKGIAIVFLIFIIGGIGGVYFDQKVLPFIRTNKHLSRVLFFSRLSENVTVINKTEQVLIKEDDSVNKIASQASNAVVNIISVSDQKEKGVKELENGNKSGTGVVVTSDGLIATYRNAIKEQSAIYRVFLSNGNNYPATLLNIDEFSDLAFLKIEASNLTAIQLADSRDALPGKKIIAIGNSFGEYQNRYEGGLLSNVNKTFNLSGKTVASSEKLEGVFEDDFNNQKEYIGGPVIGYSGDMLGIIGMLNINGEDRYFQIPANVIKNSIDLILQDKNFTRPYFGAYYISITKEYAIANNLKRDRGALIYSPSGKQGLAMISGSPAEKAGLQINDIIVSVNSQGVNLDNPLSNLIAQYKKGDTIEMTVDRSGEEIKIPVEL
ncbi:MAG TPA: S1C family serine protease [Candidatus Moranbacteria bacterium]|nr:S1C family serine protease [Candidatus Moranbacteria bacterium]